MTLRHLPVAIGEGQLTQYRIDQAHSNAFMLWKSMGSPTSPNGGQYAQLVKAGQLAAESAPPVSIKDGNASVKFALPRQGVYLFVLEM